MSNSYVNDFTDTIKIYLNELVDDKYDPIPEPIENDLFKKYKNGNDKAYKQLIEAHLRLVVNIAKKYKGTGVEISELISEGNLGLMESIKRFDPEKGVRLCVYANCWITKYIIDAIKAKSKINSNENSFDEFNTEEKERDDYIYATEEVENDTNSFSFAQEESNKENREFYNETVSSLTKSLDERSKFIIERYYGLNNHSPMSVVELSETLNISTERIRQIKTKAMMTLRSQALVQNISAQLA